MDSEDNSFTTINETYKIWKKHSPFLYSVLQTYQLPSCSQSLDWFSDSFIENDWKISSLLIGSNSISQNTLHIISVGLPTEDSLTDYSNYREEKPEVGIQTNGFVGTMGNQQVSSKINIAQAGEVMKVRINRFDENYIAVKIGGQNQELVVYDLRNKEQDLQNNCIRLQGHEEEGFGLCWSPHEMNRLLSGSYDRNIFIYNLEKAGAAEANWKSSDGVEDVKWSNFNPNIFASAQVDEKISLWDIRSGDATPFISRKAHNGQVYSIDFNKKSEFLLLSGGEDGDVNMWDVRNMSRKLHTFVGHNDAVSTVSWSPYSAFQFVSGSSDRRVVVWDVQKLNLNTEDKTGNEIVFIHGGHRSKVTEVSWNRELPILGSCEQNNILQVWKMSESITAN